MPSYVCVKEDEILTAPLEWILTTMEQWGVSTDDKYVSPCVLERLQSPDLDEQYVQQLQEIFPRYAHYLAPN